MENTKTMIPFEVREFLDRQGRQSKGIFIDGELFDWSIDEGNFRDAMSLGAQYFQSFQRDIEDHFIESLSEFMNRPVTNAEVNEATKTGWIAK